MKTSLTSPFSKKTSAALGGYSGLFVLLVKISKNMKNLAIILLVLSAMFFSTCKNKNKDCREKGDCPPEYYFKSMGEAKDYLWAKPGSYWIYKNTKTGNLDTVTCVASAFDTLTSKGTEDYSLNVTIDFEHIFKGSYSTFSPYSYTETTSTYTANTHYLNNVRVILSRECTDGLIECFFYPFDKDFLAGTGSMYCKYIGMDSVYSLQGKTYNNVAKFDIDKDDIGEPKLSCIRAHTIYYWAKNVGLIKKEVLTCNYNWELIEYNVIK